VELRRKLDSIRAKQKDVGQLIRMGGGDEALRQAKKLKIRVAEYEKVLQETESELMDLSELLPNATHPDVPHGDESKAIELERFGPEPSPADHRRDHLDICNHFDWLDSSASAQATGSSWPYLKGALAILEHALVQYALSIAVRRGFVPVQTPDVIKEDIMARCGFRPRDPSQTGQTYYLSTSSPAQEDTHQPYLVLTATAEIPLAALTANQILPESSLPIKYVGHGRAFRAEAGARGADTRGLYRVHQFTKVELFAVTRAEESDRMMEELRSVQRDIFEGLGLTCR
jgi:seryl-tRNA synthetase